MMLCKSWPWGVGVVGRVEGAGAAWWRLPTCTMRPRAQRAPREAQRALLADGDGSRSGFTQRIDAVACVLVSTFSWRGHTWSYLELGTHPHFEV